MSDLNRYEIRAERHWPGRLLRLAAVLNLCQISVGCLLVLSSLMHPWFGGPGHLVGQPLRTAEFMLAISLALIFGLTIGTAYIWRDLRRGAWLCLCVYAMEIMYFAGTNFLTASLTLSPSSRANALAESIRSASSLGNAPLLPQTLTGFPVLMIIILATALLGLSRSRQKDVVEKTGTRQMLIIAILLPMLVAAAGPSPINLVGTVTDTLAGFHGADENHADAAQRNVKAGMALYAVYDEQTRKLYIIDPQDSAVSFIGERVTVTGTLATSPMQLAGQMVDPTTGAVKSFHRVVNDSTPIGGVITNASISLAPVPSATGN